MKKSRKKIKKDPIENYVKTENYGTDEQMAQMDFSAAFKVKSIGDLNSENV